jgi:DNA-3-methyladenine glycosylase II
VSCQSFTITPQGPFSLAEAATFGFGQRDGLGWDGVMRLAFCLDGYQQQVGVEVRQDAAGLHCAVYGPAGADLATVRRQVGRVLSLDHDGDEFQEVGARDPVIGRLQAAAPGLRPPLFYSPYEAAAWSVLSARRPARQMMQVRQRLSQAHGAVFDLAGQPLAAFPAPGQLLEVESFPGIAPDRMERLHGVASAALAGQLDAGFLTGLGPDCAMAELQAIKGIGPFYSELIVVRGTGFADVLPAGEPKVLALTARLYHLDEPPALPRFRELAEAWRPFRTWAAVLIRAVTPRILDDGRADQRPAVPAGAVTAGSRAATRQPPATVGPADRRPPQAATRSRIPPRPPGPAGHSGR